MLRSDKNDDGIIINNVNKVIPSSSGAIKPTAKRLSERVEFLQSFIEKLPDGFCIIDQKGHIDYVNTPFCRMLGFKKESILGRPFSDFLDETSYQQLQINIRKKTNLTSMRIVWKTAWAEALTSLVSILLFPDIKSHYSSYAIVITEITGQKPSLTIINEGEVKYQNLADRSNDGVGIIQNGIFKYVNNTLARICGYEVNELVGTSFIQLLTLTERDSVQDKYLKRMSGHQVEKVYQSTIINKIGEEKYIEINADIIQLEGENADLVIVRDITEEKKLDQALRESENKYKQLQRNIPLGLYRTTPDGNILFANPATVRLLGCDSWEELERQNIITFYANKNDRLTLLYNLNTFGTQDGVEVQLKRKDGSLFWASISSNTVYNSRKEPLYYDGIIRDISEKKQAEEALRESEEKFRLISEQSITALVIIQKGYFKYFNKAFCEMSGYSQDEIKAWKAYEFTKTIHHEDVKFVLDQGKNKMQGNRNALQKFSFRGITKYDEVKWIDIYSRVIRYNGLPAILMTLADITERKKIQEELQKAQKLESTGLLAGGIAHDFNNRLSVILGNAQLARMNVNDPQKLERYLQNIESSASQATSLTQQLLTFSKGGKPIKTVCSVKQILEEAINLSLSGTAITCNTLFADNLLNIEVDKGQLTQVINNLLINAEQATPGGGAIDIIVNNYHALGQDIKEGFKDGNYIHIIIKDYGVGIPPEILEKIFDPFFTTKQKGSGLGLAVVYSIIEKHNGHIKVHSTPGKGTQFDLFLPATHLPVVYTVSKTAGVIKGSGKILVMDDEEFVLDMVCDLLERLGFTTLKAKDGLEAIEIYQKHLYSAEPVKLIIMDLTIPGGLGGKETITRLKNIDPNVRAIVSSGYSNDPIMSHFRNFGFSGVIAKPYKLNTLQDVIQKALK
ncbi:MAG TPA: PAS domain S-box protein [bacterium]|nr:PAS domain S-box protein [bacterium]HPN43555.1 PAS domain S-box protein [bacterium]